MSLQVHPDRVAEADKELAKEKFQLLTRLYRILIDPIKRGLYLEFGIMNDEIINDSNIEPKVTKSTIQNFKEGYVGKFKFFREASNARLFHMEITIK